VAIRDKLAKNVQPYLQPGEQLQSVFCAQSLSQYHVLLSVIFFLRNPLRVVAATDRRIVVFYSGRFTMTPVKGVVAEFDRTTHIGPPSGLWYECDRLGPKLYIHRRFHKDVKTADAMIGMSTGLLSALPVHPAGV